MTAQEARELLNEARLHLDKTYEERYNSIMLYIKKAITKNLKNNITVSSLPKAILEKLKLEGYKIETYSDWRDGDYVIISW